MIRFGCPSCDKVYKVPVTLGGKPATCTQCSARFLIPVPPKPLPPPVDVVEAEVVEDDPLPPPVEVLEAEVVEEAPPPLPKSPSKLRIPVVLEPCSGCGAVQTVSSEDLGQSIECPFCRTVYKCVERKVAVLPADPLQPLPPAAPVYGSSGSGVLPPGWAPPVQLALPPPPPPPPPAPPPVEFVLEESEKAPPPQPDVPIAPCPNCRAELTVAASDLGWDTECPFCHTIYKAVPPQPKEGTSLARVVRRNPTPPPASGKKPYQFRRDDDDRRRKRK
jgi:hypothetical protein